MPSSENRLICSRSHSQALAWLGELLGLFAGQNGVLVLAASRGAADDFVRRSCGTGVRGVHRMTVTQLAAQLAAARMAEDGVAPLSGLAAEAVCARIVYELHKSEKLDYFSPVALMPGFARAVKRTLTECRLQDVPAHVLSEGGPPAQDLARLLDLFEQELQQRKLADFPDILRLAAEETEKTSVRWLEMPLLLADVPLDEVRVRALLERVIARSPRVAASVHPSDEKALAWLEHVLKTRAESPPETVVHALDRARTHLFLPETSPPAGPDDTIEFFSAPGEAMECVEIARRIGALAKAGTRFDDIALVLRDPNRYQAHAEEAFRRAGIPAYFSRGTMRPDAAGRAFLALLSCALERCSASRFAEYLSLAQVPELQSSPSREPFVQAQDEMLASFSPAVPSGEDEKPELPGRTIEAPAGWEQLIVDAAVVGGPDRWERRLRGLEWELRLRLAEAGDDEPRRARIERDINRLQDLSDFALPLIRELAALPAKAKWGQWLDVLAALAQRALRRPDSVLATLGELRSMDEVGPVTLEEAAGVLAKRLRFLRSEPPARRYGRVFAGTPEELRGRSFQAVFVPGLAEGVFPAKENEDPLLLDVHRLRISAQLPVRKDLRIRERLLLRQCAAAADRQLVVSYPRYDLTDSRSRVPSLYALELIRAAEGRIPPLAELEERARQACSLRLDRPAPVDPAHAIDDTEFDLASVHRAVRGADRSRGSLRYLIELNPALGRSLRAFGRRWRNVWSYADGMVDGDAATRAALEAHRLSSKAYSASALQQFAACPYRFLLYGVYELRAARDAAGLEQLDPLTRGAIFHEMQRDILRGLKTRHSLPLKRDELERAFDLADREIARVARKYAEDLAPAIPRVWSNEIEDLRNDIRGWLEQMAQAGGEWIPIHFELGFGLPSSPDRDPASTADHVVLSDSTRLRGAIDLVERHAARGTLRVTDHKTGKPPERIIGYVGGGTTLQPLMYAVAARELLGAPAEASRLSYCTQRGKYQIEDVPVGEQSLAYLSRVFQIVDAAIDGAFLPAAPAAGACEMCDYRLVCGPDAERYAAKKLPDDRHAPILELRGLA